MMIQSNGKKPHGGASLRWYPRRILVHNASLHASLSSSTLLQESRPEAVDGDKATLKILSRS